MMRVSIEKKDREFNPINDGSPVALAPAVVGKILLI